MSREDGKAGVAAKLRAVDRRRFVKAAAAGAGAILAGARPEAAGADAASASPRPDAASAPWVRTRQTPDIAVVGAGAFGAWTALHLQQSGAQVTLVDQYGPANSRATSGGETRGVRTGYGGHPHELLWMGWAKCATDITVALWEQDAGVVRGPAAQ